MQEKKSQEKILYVTDLDGTLLNSSERINEKSLAIINELVEQGMLFTYATARSIFSSSVVAKGLSANIPVIVHNGVMIIHPATGQMLHFCGFTEEEQQNAVDFFTRQQIYPLVYSMIDGRQRVSYLTDGQNEGMRHYVQSRKDDKRLRPVSRAEHLFEGDIFYFTCIGEREELLPLQEFFAKDKNYTCTFQQEIYRPEYWFEIMPKKATKAQAITRLKEMWGCKKIVSFGDAINDLPMFRMSDECYAVDNAVAELKAVATGVIGSNNEDSVALWLKEHAVINKE